MTSIPTSASARRRIRDWLGVTARGTAWLLLAALLVLYSWNLFAPDMLNADPIRYRHALGLVVFAAVLASVLRAGGVSRCRHGHR